MADAPELILRRALSVLLAEWDLAVNSTAAQIPERGIKRDGIMPTSVNDFTMLTSPPTMFEGRADALYRVQFYTRRKGSPLLVENWAAELATRLNLVEYTPSILGISWTWETSRRYFDADSQGRVAVACTYAFRGRRG